MNINVRNGCIEEAYLYNDTNVLFNLGVLGNSSKCFVSFLGLLTNCTTLIIFHRRKWFKQKQMLFFTASTVTNLMSCITIFIPTIIFLSLLKFESSLSMKQTTCLAYIMPSATTNTISMRFGLLIAIDRLLAQWHSFEWFRSPVWKKWVLISIICVWSIFQIVFWFYFVDKDKELPWCFWNDLAFPKHAWWHPVVELCNFSFNLLTVVFFLLVPLSTICRPSKSFIKQINSECFIMYEQNIFLKNRETLARIRLLSFIYVAGFLCTLCVGSFLAEVAASCYFLIQFKTSLLLSSLSDILMNVHFTFTPFIFLLDASFRHELKRFLCNYRYRTYFSTV